MSSPLLATCPSARCRSRPGGISALVVTLLGGCASVAPTVEPQRTVMPRSLPLVMAGVSADEPTRRCSSEEAVMGPYTVGGSWGAGGWTACRTGPSPRYSLERALRNDHALGRCLEAAGVHWLEGRVHVGATGTVARLVVEALKPREAPVEPCLSHLTRAVFMKAGCAFDGPLRFGVM